MQQEGRFELNPLLSRRVNIINSCLVSRSRKPDVERQPVDISALQLQTKFEQIFSQVHKNLGSFKAYIYK